MPQRVDAALAVDELDGLPGAHLLAGGRQAVLAHVRDPVAVGGAGMAGVGDDVDKGRLVILLGNGGVIHALGHEAAGLDAAHGKTHGKPHPLTGNGTLQEDGLPVQGLVAGNDEEGQILGLGIVVAVVGHPSHFGKNFFADIRDEGRNSTHNGASLKVFCFIVTESYRTVKKEIAPGRIHSKHRMEGIQ